MESGMDCRETEAAAGECDRPRDGERSVFSNDELASILQEDGARTVVWLCHSESGNAVLTVEERRGERYDLYR